MKKLLILAISLFLAIKASADPRTSIDPIKYYKEALENIKKMLAGERNLSFRDAVFLTENAYAENKLSYEKYILKLYSIVQDVKAIREGLSLKYDYFDKYSVFTNAAIFQYFTDTLSYEDIVNKTTKYKYPYQYNFEDPLGEQSWSNMFVSTLLEKEKGNCHSLPYLYQIIANEFQVESHLVVAPNHLYITHLCHDPAITWYNTELTSGTHPIDSWIKITTYMSMEAIRSGIYGLPLDEKQSIALTLVDLANGYIRKFPDADITFAKECVDLALQHFPLCINAMLLKLNLLSKEYQKDNKKATKQLMDELATQIHQLGYDEMPRQMYEDWLEGKREYDPNYKPFEAFNEQQNKEYKDLIDQPLLTASNGRYLESHWTDSLELIGNILYDTKHKRVAQILFIDTADIVSRIPRDVASRWLSPDPMAGKYPSLSPYNFVNNSPIKNIEVDGRVFVDANGNKISKEDWVYSKNGQISVREGVELGADLQYMVGLVNSSNSKTAIKVFQAAASNVTAINVDIVETPLYPSDGQFLKGSEYPNSSAIEYHAPHDKDGPIGWIQGENRFERTPDYVYDEKGRATGYREATVFIFTGNMKGGSRVKQTEAGGSLKQMVSPSLGNFHPPMSNTFFDQVTQQEAELLTFVHALVHDLFLPDLQYLKKQTERKKPADSVESTPNSFHDKVLIEKRAADKKQSKGK